jgi:transcriptional regulator with XRE-family HTH domain
MAAGVDRTLPVLVRRYRAERNLRQLDLGRRIAEQAHDRGIGMPPVSRQTIGRWERGQAPTDLYAVLLASVLGVPPAELGAAGRHLTPERVQEVITRASGARTAGVPARRPGTGVVVDWERLMRRLRAVIEEDLGISGHGR